MQGEVRHFVREIETKKGDREVNDTFEILQVGTAHSVSFTKIGHFVNKIAYQAEFESVARLNRDKIDMKTQHHM